MPTGGAARALLLLLLGGALWANSLRNAFVWDDRLTVAAGPGAARIVTARTGPYSRPLVHLSFAAERALWGQSPVGFRVTNVLCHLGVAWLLGALVLRHGAGAGAALTAALVFAAHPVQTEAVTYISGRTDVLCALFTLLALFAWRRARHGADRWAVATAGALGAALLSKEAAAAVPLALLAPGAHPAADPPRPLLPLLAWAAWLVAWAAGSGPGLSPAGLADRLPAVAIAALGYVRLLLWPLDLHLERFTAVAGWSPGAALGAWATVGALGGVLVLVARRVPGGWVWLAVALLAYAPVSGVVPVHPAIADRALFTPEHFLYLPLLGLVPLVVTGLAAVWPARARALAPAVLSLVLAGWGAVVVDRNRDWRDEETLFRHTLAHDPPVARVWFNFGNLALGAGRLEEAERLYTAALAREPGDGAAQLNLGIALQRQGRLGAAEARYRQALASDPRLAEAYRALAALLARRGATAEAARLWAEGERLAR